MGSSWDSSYKLGLVLSSSLHTDFPLVRRCLKGQPHRVFISPSKINTKYAYLCIVLQNTIKMRITGIAVQPRNWFQKMQQKETEVKSGSECMYLHVCTCCASDASSGGLEVDSCRIYSCSDVFWHIPFEVPVIYLQHQQLCFCSAISSWLNRFNESFHCNICILKIDLCYEVSVYVDISTVFIQQHYVVCLEYSGNQCYKITYMLMSIIAKL